jgi:hypothetical protein
VSELETERQERGTVTGTCSLSSSCSAPTHTHARATAFMSSSIFLGHKACGHDIQFSSRWTGHTEHKNLPSASYHLMFRYVPPVISTVYSKWRMHKIHKIAWHRHKAPVASSIGRVEISWEISTFSGLLLLFLSSWICMDGVPSSPPSAAEEKRWEDRTVTNSNR